MLFPAQEQLLSGVSTRPISRKQLETDKYQGCKCPQIGVEELGAPYQQPKAATDYREGALLGSSVSVQQSLTYPVLSGV